MNFEARIASEEGERAPELAQGPVASRRTWLVIAGAAAMLVAIWFLIHRGDRPAAADSASQRKVNTRVWRYCHPQAANIVPNNAIMPNSRKK